MNDSPMANIMVVDDTLANLRLLSGMLSDAGYSVRSLPRGDLALKAAANDPPDLILLDINMPGMNGFDVCEQLKADPALKEIPVIFISALTETLDKVKAFNCGGVDYVTKPFQFEEVYARVEAHLKLKNAYAQLYQQEKMAAVGHLAAGVAHEINNPVGFVTSNLYTLSQRLDKFAEYIDLLSDKIVAQGGDGEALAALRKEFNVDYLIDDSREMVSESLEGTARVTKIVKGMKDFSRIDMGEDAPVKINDCIDTTLDLVWNQLQDKCTLHKEYAELPEIGCYGQKLNQVFMHLLLNAGQSIAGHGEIRIRTWLDEDSICVAITDDGCGIPAENLGRIFNPFFTTREIGEGVGLGLSVSRDIIKSMAGEITVVSEVDKGSEFTIKIPIEAQSL